MADDTNTAERESFEAWASQSVGRVWRDTAPGRTEDYLDASTNLCWRAWLARASLAASAGSEPVALDPRHIRKFLQALQADSVLEDAARWQFVESAPSAITLRLHNLRPDQRAQYVDAARKQGGKHD